MGTERGEVILVGASVRAAAGSALRAGLRPWAVDLFADVDLRVRCAARRLEEPYPEGFLTALEAAPVAPLLYTGGLENHPQLVDRLGARRVLWGNSGTSLRRAREPELLRAVAQEAGLPAPRGGPPDGSGRWLVKPLSGAGGHGIKPWEPAQSLPPRCHWQEYIDGPSLSVVYVAAAGEAQVVGTTWQLVGEAFLGAEAFHYCGSIGPVVLPAGLLARVRRLGARLAVSAQLRGLFGVDGILRDGDFWPVEVNPRYPASVEVLEHALGVQALALHRVSCEEGRLMEVEVRPAAEMVGKAILFARRGLRFPGQGPWEDDAYGRRAIDALPAFADIPAEGEGIEAGHPVLTFFVRGADAEACRTALERGAASIETALYAGEYQEKERADEPERGGQSAGRDAGGASGSAADCPAPDRGR
ncbi:MAG: ATP-grasp domain-containing protein [Gemmataceae bacterium]